MLDITGRHADGWWPAGCYSPDDYAAKLKIVREAAERAGRDPMAIVPAFIITCLIGDDAELAEILAAPLVKALVLQFSAAVMRQFGHEHPLGDGWRGYHDIDPRVLTRDKILALLERVDVQSILDLVPHGTPKQVARIVQGYCEAGLRVPKILDYGGMAGLAYAAGSAQKVREAEDELMRLVGNEA
jgi:phthiodiolone/phenolphthiodiolone dimycocerosates ketoreductase